MKTTSLTALLGLSLAAATWACTGPPPLHLKLVADGHPEGKPVHITAGKRLVVRAVPADSIGREDPMGAVAGVPVPGSGDRVVHLDGSALEGEAFSVSAIGPTPSMLLQWGGLDGEHPTDPTRRRGYAVEIHRKGSALPKPAGWTSGDWDPSTERWYSEPGALTEDAQVTRWLHRNMGSRFGEETEPWIKLERDAQGRALRLHLWLVVGAGFSNDTDLTLRLQVDRGVRTYWDRGDGRGVSSLTGGPGSTLRGRLTQEFRYLEPSPPGGYPLRCEVALDWSFGRRIPGSRPWVWEATVQSMGFVDLSPLASQLSAGEQEALASRVDAIRSRLRCMPGDHKAAVFEKGEPCTYVPAATPDAFLDPGPGGAVPALLGQLLPERLVARAADLPRGGDFGQHTLRWSFSGVFPYGTASTDDPQTVRDALGRPGELAVVVKAKKAP